MFWSSLTRLRDWLENADDFLGDPADDVPARNSQPTIAVHPHPHPHRRPLRSRRERRPGMVAPRPAHCLSPVRHERGSLGVAADEALR